MGNYLLFFTLLVAFTFSSAQSNQTDTSEYPYWIEMMQDPKANFFETQKAFEMYWDGRERDKGDGWKPFKRWEWFMEQRVDIDGNKPAPDHVLNEYNKYFSNTQKSWSLEDKNHWKEIGPINLPTNGTSQPNGLGRVNCLGFHPSNQNIIYAGAASGGLWRTTNHGQTWDVLTDTLPTLGVSAVVVDFNDPDIIYIGTGDRDGGDAPGLGIWKSTDEGISWNPSNTGLGNEVVGRLLMNPQDRNTLIAATSDGIYKSTNAGQSWVRKSSNNNHYKDLVYKPGDTSTVYAVAGGTFYRSLDGGENWLQVTNGISGGANRAVIGVSPANSNYVYLVHCHQRTFKGLYRSANSGSSFSLQSTSPNIMDYSYDGSGNSGQAWYDLCIVVDPLNVNTLYVGGVNIFKSVNGGQNWAINAHWTGTNAPDIHADQHTLRTNPLNWRIYSGNDGGVYYTGNGGNNWIDISEGLAIAQIYKIGQSATSEKLVINGYQDNGTAIYNGEWKTEIGGDGMECIVDPIDTNYMYGALYYGDIRRSSNAGTWFSKIASSITETGEWVTPYILQEGNPSTMIAGFKNVWITTNARGFSVNWTQISNNLASTNGQGIRVLENSPVDNDVLFVSRKDGYLFRSDNITASSPIYTNLRSGLPTSTWPRDIEAHPTNVNKVYMVQSNKVYESSNKGQTWTNISGTLPNVSMNCIVYDSSSSGDLYVGSDLGVFFKGSWMNDWKPYSGGLPYSIEVTELEIFYGPTGDQSRIKAATYGRGLWASPLYERPIADFEAEDNQLCVGQSVQFNNLTEGTYDDVLWLFEGGTPDSSKADNPVVTYNQPGTFDVEMRVNSPFEQDVKIKTDEITVDSIPAITISPSMTNINRGDTVILTASGAQVYTWSPTTGLDKFKGAIVKASPKESTTYSVVGTNTFCATGGGTAQAVVNVLETGLDEHQFEGGNIHIYPNPATGSIQIRVEGIASENIQIKLIDGLGRISGDQVRETSGGSSLITMDLSHIPSGLYLLCVEGKTERVITRIVVDH